MQATIKDVARSAGVSISSVSRALNGNTTNEELIDRVRRAVAEVGYVPMSAAQSLRRKRTGQVAFAVEDIGNPAYLMMVRAMQPLLKAAGIRLVLHSTGGVVDDEVAVLQSLKQGYVDGLIICPLRVTADLVQEIEEAPVPIVVIGNLPQPARVDNVRTDSRHGALLATQHLLEGGARRIGYIGGPRDSKPGALRLAGYKDGLVAAGVVYNPKLVVESRGFKISDGTAAARQLLESQGVDAVFGSTDWFALAAMRVLQERSLRVPEDVRVIGMDDTDLATLSYPSLTSVSLNSAERGRQAAGMLLDRLTSEDEIPPRTVSIAPYLSIRESAGVET